MGQNSLEANEVLKQEISGGSQSSLVTLRESGNRKNQVSNGNNNNNNNDDGNSRNYNNNNNNNNNDNDNDIDSNNNNHNNYNISALRGGSQDKILNNIIIKEGIKGFPDPSLRSFGHLLQHQPQGIIMIIILIKVVIMIMSILMIIIMIMMIIESKKAS